MPIDVCSMFARMPRYTPAQPGIHSAARMRPTGQNGSSRHVLPLFDSRSRRRIECRSGLLIRGYEDAGCRLYPRYLRDLAVAAHAARRGEQRRLRLRYQVPAARPVPMFRTPAEESGLRSQHSRQTIRAPGKRKAVRRYIGVTRSGSPASTRIRQVIRRPRAARHRPQRAAPPAEWQPACHAATDGRQPWIIQRGRGPRTSR
jgi:hypothetical protein